MKVIIVYFSQTGNTEKVAENIYEFLKQKNIPVSIFKLLPEKEYSFVKNCQLALREKEIPLRQIPDTTNFDFLFIGTPVWAFNITPAVRTFLNKADLNGKEVFLFITYGSGTGKNRAMKKFENLIKEKGATIKGKIGIKGKKVIGEKQRIEKEVEKCLKE